MRTKNSSSAIFLFDQQLIINCWCRFSFAMREGKKIIEILNNGIVPAKSSWDQQKNERESQNECKKCVGASKSLN